MVNINGVLQSQTNNTFENRGYKYGDSLFETLKVVNGKLFFWEDHYFRLMASMRIMRMEIPSNFTMEFLEAEILKTIDASSVFNRSARVRLNVDRGIGGKYLPLKDTTVSFNIIVEPLETVFYTISKSAIYTVDLYKDYYMAPGLLSGLKSNNKALQVMGSIYAKENDLDNCFVLNTNKNVIETLNGNVFLVNGTTIKTPPLEDGCLKGVIRKQILQLLAKDVNLNIEETSISPFELQKADEIFTTNVIKGIVPITNYRKKTYSIAFATSLVAKLNIELRLT